MEQPGNCVLCSSELMSENGAGRSCAAPARPGLTVCAGLIGPGRGDGGCSCWGGLQGCC